MDLGRAAFLAAVLVAGTAMIGVRDSASAEGDVPMLDMLLKPDTEHDPKANFKVLDEDGDGKISRAEFSVHKMTVFYKKDIDRDTKLTRGEFPIISSEAFKAEDRDNDGKLSAFEFNQADFAKFERFDTDKDGVITLDEVLEFRARMK